jgi:peptidoglycan/xylan/chitin deacetylase (PgdA/CDA1 family)
VSDARRRRIQRWVGILLIPLSLVPFLVYFRNTAEGRLLWTRATASWNDTSLPDVRVVSPGFAPYADGVAVLVYHGIGQTADAEGRFTLSRSQFAEQLATMRAAGMHFVTARQVARAWRTGRPLPPDAVMITFDDGRAEAMLLADPLLAAAHARATMFVIGDAVDDPGIFYASEDELRDYAASGRWDLESHTAGLHGEQDTDLGALPRLTSRAPGESLAGYRRRVSDDLDRIDGQIRDLTGHRPVAFAYPFGAYGGDRTNDVRLRNELALILARRYALAFQQDDQSTVPLARCHDRPLELRRLDVGQWSGPELLARIGAMQRHTWPLPACPSLPTPVG